MVLHRLKAADGAAELLANFGVFDRGVDEVARETEEHRRNAERAAVERARERGTRRLTRQAMCVDAEGDQVTRKRRRAPSTECSGSSVTASRDTRVELVTSLEQEQIGDVGIGDEGGALEPHREPRVSGRDAGKPERQRLGIRRLGEQRRTDGGGFHDRLGQCRAAALLEQQDEIDLGEPEPAVRFGNGEPDHAELGQLAPQGAASGRSFSASQARRTTSAVHSFSSSARSVSRKSF